MKAHAGQINNRRMKALLRLEEQLVNNLKPLNDSNFEDKDVNFDNFGLPLGLYLTKEDKVRINKEISTLKGRITSPEVARSHKPKKYRGVL